MLEKYVCAWTRRLLGGRARDRWMTRYDSRLRRRPARVCVCRVCMFCAFCISAAVLRAVFSCIVAVYALWCSQKIESDSRDSACEPAPSPLLRSSLTHAHRCIGPRNQPGRCLHTGWSGEGRVPMPFSLPVLFSYVSGPQRVSDFVESTWNCL